jgi:hypothetical protein
MVDATFAFVEYRRVIPDVSEPEINDHPPGRIHEPPEPIALDGTQPFTEPVPVVVRNRHDSLGI